ncbi:hypothetical protein HNR06_005234 [Nocardiopsis arvandica]|uniref:Uncharacterized protein n=1 Tax=Nocardiopsis sinuspersici TaxID=501010 RepID=A0A7Y9XJE0_9ACTN|nr:hypothetical protein [Nocardiopsis sinuspersici]
MIQRAVRRVSGQAESRQKPTVQPSSAPGAAEGSAAFPVTRIHPHHESVRESREAWWPCPSSPHMFAVRPGTDPVLVRQAAGRFSRWWTQRIGRLQRSWSARTCSVVIRPGVCVGDAPASHGSRMEHPPLELGRARRPRCPGVHPSAGCEHVVSKDPGNHERAGTAQLTPVVTTGECHAPPPPAPSAVAHRLTRVRGMARGDPGTEQTWARAQSQPSSAAMRTASMRLRALSLFTVVVR